ncbi:MAG: glucose-6-phosphate isomerase [Gammaproteobacteria bacterium]|nr:glucose-6-phosphate isomerase [Gammaproteobacteria bacterium]
MSTHTDSSPWKALVAHQKSLSGQSISALFSDNPERFDHFSVEAAGLLLDYSKNLVTAETLELLTNLAEEAGLQKAISAMFSGEVINTTENRPALHVALRSPEQNTEFEKIVHSTLDQMESFVNKVTSWQWQGCNGDPITDVVNIGIGGSDLGPAMVYEAMSDYHLDGIRCHFVSNIDPAHLEQTLEELNPATTLFVIASKTFTTLETMLNAQAARAWFLNGNGNEQDLGKHFVAVSANVDKASDFGIDPGNIFPLWDWVGGRFSLWSAIGLPVALGIGMDNFRALLAGANEMDIHFQKTRFETNIPVLLGLLDIWYTCFLQAESKAILPYSQKLELLPAWMQQLSMESLGKSVDSDGSVIDFSGQIIWGSAGTNGQHSFHQLLHQGTHLIHADFIAVAKVETDKQEQHEQLLANCFAQSHILMCGKEDDDPHKKVLGNKPSNTLILKKLYPHSLGSLLATYEHSVFVQSVLLDINAFDQWGVEAGKTANTHIYAAMTSTDSDESFDPSTDALIDYLKKL